MSKLLSVILIFAMASCSSTKNTSKDEQSAPEVNTIELTQQDVFPGVYSNLKKSRTYNAVVSANFPEPVELKAILVDSVRLPIKLLSLNGEDQRQPYSGITGTFETCRMVTNRNFYQDTAPKMLEEILPDLSGRVLKDGQVLLEIGRPNGDIYIDLGTLTTKDAMHAP